MDLLYTYPWFYHQGVSKLLKHYEDIDKWSLFDIIVSLWVVKVINPGEIQDRKVRAPKSKMLMKMSKAWALRTAQQKIYRPMRSIGNSNNQVTMTSKIPNSNNQIFENWKLKINWKLYLVSWSFRCCAAAKGENVSHYALWAMRDPADSAFGGRSWTVRAHAFGRWPSSVASLVWCKWSGSFIIKPCSGDDLGPSRLDRCHLNPTSPKAMRDEQNPAY